MQSAASPLPLQTVPSEFRFRSQAAPPKSPLQPATIEYSLLMLVLVNASQEVTPPSLAKALGISMPRLDFSADRLEARGLLRRDLDAADSESGRIHLTAKGRELVHKTEAVAASMDTGRPAPMSLAERALLSELLERMDERGPR
ncbi:MarR family winged helix-turn-helix transcriptional regulator [Variovorax paradoxus]|uniref:Regulatory protein MarR n=1 Tax=Variovorax paradoxus (strain EPS) TaxID=595537 RepID=E6V226_VARPE|nr:MarR family transcriptional regulator [Variovorax paradoxus]ADU39105.1 regulatory protein MarR [Variovorax paradoxus EPS]